MGVLLETFIETSAPLQNADFRKIWISQCCGQTATNLLHFALVLQTFSRTGSTLFVGILIAVISLPPILFSTLGGLIADRYDRRRILTAINGARIAIAFLLIFINTHTFATLAAVFFLTTFSEFFIPTESASIPALVPRDQLVNANSLSAFTLYASFLLGYASAGPLLHWGGLRMALMSAAVLYVGAGIATIGLPPIVSHLHASNDILKRTKDTFVQQLVAGLRFIRMHHLLGLVTLEIALLFGIERGVIALLPLLAARISIASPVAISTLLILPLAGGTVVGAVIVNRLKHRHSPIAMVHAGILLEASALFVFSPASALLLRMFPWYPPLPFARGFALIAALIAGLGNVMVMVSMQTYLQRETADEQRGRVFGSFITIVNGIGLPVLLLLSHIGMAIPINRVLTFLSVSLSLMAAASLSSIAVHLRSKPHLPGAVT